MSGDVTYQALKRLTWLPERDVSHNGHVIAGQDYFDIFFTGGSVSNISISTPIFPDPNSVLNSLLPSQTGNSGKALKTDGVNTSWSSDIDTGITQLTGDVLAGPGSGSQAATLATVNSNVGSFGSSTAIPSFTVNGKGLLTAAGTNVVIAPAGTLSGTTLASNVVSSSLTSVGTLTTGVWNGSIIAGQYGGTGVNNSGKTITLGGNITTSGAFNLTATLTASTSVTFPTAGTLATLAGSEALTNKSVNGVTLTTGGSAASFLNAAGSYASITSTTTTYQYLTTSGTYTTPANCKAILVEAWGAGGAGGGVTTGAGNPGTDTIFNGVHASGGAGGPTGVTGQIGGTVGATPGTGTANDRVIGNPGGPAGASSAGAYAGNGGATSRGGAGAAGNNTNGGNAAANSGSGGGGGSTTSTAGPGGQAGEKFELYISSPAASYSYTIGTGGTGAGSARTGGNGATGFIKVTETY